MKNVHDQIAKAILKAVLDSVTRLETNREIRGHVLAADLWVEPDPQHEADLQALGVLGKMIASGPCLIEPFSSAPSASDIQSCILKQYSLNHAQQRDAKAAGKSPPPFPRLWVIATGSPDSIVKDMRLAPMEEWPAGFLCGRPFDPFHLAVVRHLPKTPETLLLRLVSRGRIFQEASLELASVPQTAPELAPLAERVMRVLVVFSKELDQDQLEEEDMEALRDIDAAYNEWEHRVKGDTLIKAIRSLCLEFNIELTDQRLSQLDDGDLDQLERMLLAISRSHEWPHS